MPKGRHFGAGSDPMQQVHGANVKSKLVFYVTPFINIQ